MTNAKQTKWTTQCQFGADFERACAEAVRLARIAQMIRESIAA